MPPKKLAEIVVRYTGKHHVGFTQATPATFFLGSPEAPHSTSEKRGANIDSRKGTPHDDSMSQSLSPLPASQNL